MITMIGLESEANSLALQGLAHAHTNLSAVNASHAIQVIEEAPQSSLDAGQYEESSRKDRHEAVLAFAQSDVGSYWEELEDAKDKGEADDVRQAMGQVIEDVRLQSFPLDLEVC